MTEINRRNTKLPKREYRVEYVPPIVKNNEASHAFHKKFYESICSDPLVQPRIIEKHRRIAKNQAISAGMRNKVPEDSDFNSEQINGEEL